MRRIVIIVLSIIVLVSTSVMFVSCKSTSGSNDNNIVITDIMP